MNASLRPATWSFLIALSACGGSPAAPSATASPLSETTTSEHYVVHFAPGDSVDTAWQDRYYEWLVPALQVQSTTRLEYNKYRDRAHLKALTGKETNGFAEPGTARFHTIWPTDNHEGVHTLVMLTIGMPPS